MKAAVCESKPLYVPKTLTITIESQDEEHLLLDLLVMDETIPTAVYRRDGSKKASLAMLMGTIHKALTVKV